MKNTIITLFLLSLFTTGFAQELKYNVRGAYARSVVKETIVAAKTISDICPGYPSSWITDYISTEVSATSNGKTVKSSGINDTLTAAQINLLNGAEAGAEIVVDVSYNYKNAVTNNVEVNQMHFSVTLIPDVEAGYLGGTQELLEYLKEMAVDKIAEIKPKDFKQAMVRFTVDEHGNVTHARMSLPSEFQAIDNIMLEAIQKMRKWKPAENSKGTKVSQDFEFLVQDGLFGC